MSAVTALIPVTASVLVTAATSILLTVPLQHRGYCLPTVLLPATLSIGSLHYLSFIPGLADVWGLLALFCLLHSLSLLYLKGWTLRSPAQAPCNSTPSNSMWYKRRLWLQMYRISSNPRFVNVDYGYVKLPNRNARARTTSIHKPFTPMKVLHLLMKFAALLVMNYLVMTWSFGTLSMSDFEPEKQILFRRMIRSIPDLFSDPIIWRDFAIRIWVTINTFLVPMLLLDGMHVISAVLFIYIFYLDKKEDWPDLYGNPLEAYTLRRFWTK